MKHIIVALALAAVSFNAVAGCYSEGVRRGQIQKFSQKGLVNKSWEGEMVQEGLRTKEKTKITNIWKFSVTSADVAKKINDAMFEGGDVAVKYCQEAFSLKMATDTSYIVTDAKALK